MIRASARTICMGGKRRTENIFPEPMAGYLGKGGEKI